jgi:hypothetical protein
MLRAAEHRLTGIEKIAGNGSGGLALALVN